MMRETGWLIRKTWISVLKKWSNLLLYFVLPVLGVAIAMLAGGGTTEASMAVGIVNRDGGGAVTEEWIRSIGELEWMRIRETEAENAAREVSSGKLDAAIVISEGFGESVLAGQPKQIELIAVQGSPAVNYVQGALNSSVDLLARIGQTAGGDESAFMDGLRKIREDGWRLSSVTLEDASAKRAMSSRTIGFLAVMMLFAGVKLSGMMIKERENRTWLRLMSTPVSACAYVLSNVVVNFAMMMAQIAVTLLLMMYVFRIDLGVPFVSLYAVLTVFALVAVTFALAVAAFADSSMKATGLQTMLILPSSVLAGCFFPLAIMPESLQKFAGFLPQHWLLDSVDQLQMGRGIGSVALNLAILLAFAAVFAMAAGYRFARNDDTRSFV